ncbi:MAG TPA: hypothetical protein VL651_16080 [Bacteroidia bacterium]|jgi:hypothetical protein|nr:hypothetical protein [Bacteroidia bacterium]
MGSSIYKKAFSVELSHDFYETDNKFQVNRYLEIVPDSACAKTLRSGRMRFVNTASGATVLYEAYLDTVPTPAEKPLVRLSGALEFLFVLRIKDAAEFILNVSDLNIYSGMTLDKKYGAGMKFFLNGDTGNLSLDASLIDQLRPQVFTYTFRGMDGVNPFTGNVNITVKNEDNTLTEFTFTNVASDPSTGIYSLPLDFSSLPNGLYHFEAKDVNSPFNTVHTADLYINNELSRENIFGLIRLKYASAADLYNGEKVFEYAFVKRQVRWRYYISVKNYPTGFFSSNYLEISDSASSYTFTPENSPGIPDPIFKVNGYDTVIITSTGGGPGSNGKVPFSEDAITTFKLKQLGVVTKTLIDTLPNGATIGVDSNRLNSPSIELPPYSEIFLTIDNLSTT